MKLRRAMATAAATAVIAPAALLAASPAFAAEQDETGSSETGAPVEEKTGDEIVAEESAQPLTDEPATAEPTPIPVDEDEDDTEDDDTEDEDDEGETPDGQVPGGQLPGDDEGETPGEDEDGESGEAPEDEFAFCTDLDADYEDGLLTEVVGLPETIVAGSGWHEFSMHATNVSDVDLRDVILWAEVENLKLYEDLEKGELDFDNLDKYAWLSEYVNLEFRNGGGWKALDDDGFAAGIYAELDTLPAGSDTVVTDFRISIDKDAPTVEGAAVSGGAYIGEVNGQECGWEGGWYYAFSITAPGGAGSDKEAEPAGPAKRSPDLQLAQTGAGSGLAVYALTGAAAVAMGAAAVYMVRRRGAGAAV
ncbi:hypothetical protein [Streptomyces alkaliphilus]|uniref:hypothetical protein n=1 Tax=Streptomyces alkaliphilus TaxID=1472722 RepID=UPI00117EF150|nr:hypothetical protein [Streptomyces alkaliphilus]MQS08461.1 hypothetical protein [Streptomyces alkaliphilus]